MDSASCITYHWRHLHRTIIHSTTDHFFYCVGALHYHYQQNYLFYWNEPRSGIDRSKRVITVRVLSCLLLSRYPSDALCDSCRPQTTPWTAGWSTAQPWPWSLVFLFGWIMQQKCCHLTAPFPSFLLNVSLLTHSSWSITLPRDNQRPVNSSVTVPPDEFHLNNTLTRHNLWCKLRANRVGDENCTLLGYCAASRSNSLPTFRDNLSGPIFVAQAIFYQQFRRL